MNRTTPTGSFASVDARAHQISASRSSARLTHIPPAPPSREFDAPRVLTTGTELIVLNVLVWGAIALWLVRPAVEAVQTIALQ
jgi:hypothetical protein